jgi:hypothetical protein
MFSNIYSLIDLLEEIKYCFGKTLYSVTVLVLFIIRLLDFFLPIAILLYLLLIIILCKV